MKLTPAMIACLILLPIAAGICWFSMSLSRAAVAAMAMSNGDDAGARIIMNAPTDWSAIAVYLAGYVIVCGLVLGMEKLEGE